MLRKHLGGFALLLMCGMPDSSRRLVNARRSWLSPGHIRKGSTCLGILLSIVPSRNHQVCNDAFSVTFTIQCRSFPIKNTGLHKPELEMARWVIPLLVNLVLRLNLPFRVHQRYVHFQHRNQHFLKFEPSACMWSRTHPRELVLSRLPFVKKYRWFGELSISQRFACCSITSDHLEWLP